MSGRKSRNKGYRGEKEFRDKMDKEGLHVVWQAEDPRKPDVSLENLDIEIKYRKSIPKCIYEWLEEKSADGVAMKRVEGRGKMSYPWVVCLRLEKFVSLLAEIKQSHNDLEKLIAHMEELDEV
jgi:hypothetical protein